MKKIIIGETIENSNFSNENVVNDNKAHNKERKCKARFSKMKGDMVSLGENDNEIKLKYISSKNIDIAPLFEEGNNKVIYKDVEDGVDLVYEIEETRLKESLIINEKKEYYNFNFETRINELEPNYNERCKCLELKSNDEVLYRMLPPFMVDGNGNESKNCSYEIDNSENGLLSIKLVVDEEWINDEGRVLPIVIDPTFEIIKNDAIVVYSLSNNINNGTADEVFIGYKNLDDDKKFYSFDLSFYASLFDGIDLNNSKVYFEMPVNYCTLPDNEEIIILSHESINEEEVVGIYKVSQLIFNNMISVDITETFKNALKNECTPYYSFILRKDNERLRNDYYKSGTLNNGVYKISFQNRDALGEKAKIVIEPKEESKDYVEYDVGESGVASINIQTGRYKHRFNDLSVKKGTLALNLDHIFDSRNDGNSNYGKSWSLSINESLRKDKINNKGVVVYTDSNGIEHYFVEKWFYIEDDLKIYVDKNDVTFSKDNELVVRNFESLKVKYEVVNEEGYKYISLSSMSNYEAESKNKFIYYVKYKGFKKQVIPGRMNYLQFAYYENDTTYYVDNNYVEKNSSGYIYKKGSIEKMVSLADTGTSISIYSTSVPMYIDENKTRKNVPLEKVRYYGDDNDELYSDLEIESLEFDKNKVIYALDEMNSNLSRLYAEERRCITNLANIDLKVLELNVSSEISSVIEYKNKIQSQYMELINVENEIANANEQKLSLEKTEYYTTRSYNQKIKEQRMSVNDYIIDPNGTFIMFDGYGRMIGIMDNHKNKIEINYNDDGEIENIRSEED